jgi:twitching motility protein PilT
MHTLDQHLSEMVRTGLVTYDDAVTKAQDPATFEVQVGQFKGAQAEQGAWGAGDGGAGNGGGPGGGPGVGRPMGPGGMQSQPPMARR